MLPAKRIPIVGVPRRFSAGRMMVFVSLFALLFGLLRHTGAPPWFYLVAGIYCAAVALGQVFLFGGREPRLASCIAGSGGAFLLWIACWAAVIAQESSGRGGRVNAVDEMAGSLCAGLLPVAFLGWMGGYLIGTVSAGVFLVMDRNWNAGRIVPEMTVAEVVPESPSFGRFARAGSDSEIVEATANDTERQAMLGRITRDEVKRSLDQLESGFPHQECFRCDCFQGFLTQLELDATENVSDLTERFKVPREQIHRCLGCDPCPPGSSFEVPSPPAESAAGDRVMPPPRE